MILGARGEQLIKEIEILRLVGYLPTPNDKPTAGWGHTGPDVKIGETYTLAQAQLWFLEDVSDSVNAVNKLSVKLTQSMFDALVSLVFNAGADCISGKNTIGRALRERDYFSAWAGFSLWRKQKGNDLLGLARRRAKEMVLFFEDGLPK